MSVSSMTFYLLPRHNLFFDLYAKKKMETAKRAKSKRPTGCNRDDPGWYPVLAWHITEHVSSELTNPSDKELIQTV